MVSIRKISPMARSIGTVGVVAGLVGAVTFANLTSNTVALTGNKFASASATLKISTDNISYTNSKPGMSFQTLTPGVTSNPFTFFLKNSGDIPLALTVQSLDATDGTGLSMSEITLSITCDNGSASTTLDQYVAHAQGLGSLNNGSAETCNATALLSGSHSGPGGESLPAFTLNFIGTQ